MGCAVRGAIDVPAVMSPLGGARAAVSRISLPLDRLVRFGADARQRSRPLNRWLDRRDEKSRRSLMRPPVWSAGLQRALEGGRTIVEWLKDSVVPIGATSALKWRVDARRGPTKPPLVGLSGLSSTNPTSTPPRRTARGTPHAPHQPAEADVPMWEA